MRYGWCFLATLMLAAAAGAADLSDPGYRAEVAKQFPGVSAEDITPTAAPGIWQILQGGVVGYVTADGRYLMDGDLIDLKTDFNLAAEARRQWRVDHLATLDEDAMIVYEPDDPKASVTVFTDVECRYCRALHAQIDKLLAAGIRVRYLAYPLAGPNSTAFQRAERVWCADDRKAALTAAFLRYGNGEPALDASDCTNPVKEQFTLAALTLGLRGTPAIITEQGAILPPGLPVPALIAQIKSGSQGQ